MSNHEEFDAAVPDSLGPTEGQLEALQTSVFEREPAWNPGGDLPQGVDVSGFVEMTAPPQYDESFAPASVFRTSDGRVMWISVFRNPDTNEVDRQVVQLITKQGLPDGSDAHQSFTLMQDKLGLPKVTTEEGVELDTFQADDLRRTIDTSEPIDLFGDPL